MQKTGLIQSFAAPLLRCHAPIVCLKIIAACLPQWQCHARALQQNQHACLQSHTALLVSHTTSFGVPGALEGQPRRPAAAPAQRGTPWWHRGRLVWWAVRPENSSNNTWDQLRDQLLD